MTSEAGYRPLGDWRHVAVVDACRYGRLGLVTALRSLPGIVRGPRIVAGFTTVQEALTQGGAGVSWDALIVHLPQDPLAGLALLLQLGVSGRAVMPPVPLMVLSRFQPSEVRRVLWGVGVGAGYPLKVLDDRLPVAALCAVAGAPMACDAESVLPATGTLFRLTEKERQVLLSSVQAVSVAEQARLCDRNSKTVYGQRLSAMHKLGAATLPRLLGRFGSLTGSPAGGPVLAEEAQGDGEC